MRITDVRCAILGRSPVVRIVTDAGLSGYAQAETWKPYLKPHVLAFRDALIGEDPTLVERTMLKIRQRGGFLTFYDKKPQDLIGPPLREYAQRLIGLSH